MEINSTIKKNTEITCRFIEQTDEQPLVEILATDLQKNFEQPVFLYSTTQKFFKIFKTFLSTAPVGN